MATTLDVDFKTLFSIVGPVIENAYPVIIRGRHGVGKSEVVYWIQGCLAYNPENDQVRFYSDKSKIPAGSIMLEMVERRASQMTEGDLVGLPSVNGNRTSFNPPDWFKMACEKPCLLFVDEIDRATIEVRQGFFEMTDSRKLNGHKLHPGTRIFAAVNGGKHAQQYQVGEMDPAELDRWSVFDVEPTVEDWLNWATANNAKGQRNIHSMITDFIRAEKKHLEHTEGQYEPNKKYPSRRSWKRCSDVLAHGGYLDGELSAEDMGRLQVLAAAFVGMEAAVGLGGFIRTYKRRLTPENIVNDGRWQEAEKFDTNEHVAMAEKMMETKILEKKFTDKQVDNICHYFMLLPSEVCTLLFKYLGKAGNKENTVTFYKHEIMHKGEKVKIGEYMVKMLAPQKATQTK
jgi:hypothetical protein